jgi:hypothetical protein
MTNEEETQIPLLPVHNDPESMGAPAHPATHNGFNVTDLTVNIPSSVRHPLSSASTANGKQPAPSRWGTLEFKVYYVVFLVVVPIMVWIPVSLSSRTSYCHLGLA